MLYTNTLKTAKERGHKLYARLTCPYCHEDLITEYDHNSLDERSIKCCNCGHVWNVNPKMFYDDRCDYKGDFI